MRRKLADFLQQSDLSRYYKQDQRVGDDDYHVILPFVHFDGSLARKAIKPLHLDKESPTEIYRHGDAWISSVRRLLQAKRFPGELLFTVKSPVKNAKCQSAATDICKELERLDAITIPFADTKSILNFARV